MKVINRMTVIIAMNKLKKILKINKCKFNNFKADKRQIDKNNNKLKVNK